MENRIIFREMLTEMKEAADKAGGALTQAQVREILSGIPLEEEHFQLIYDYLAEQNIRVLSGAASEAEGADEKTEDRGSLSFYLDELERFEAQDDEEETCLLERARTGDETAKSALIERYLPLICGMAGDYEGDAIPAEDLIQEGNLGLVCAMQTLGEYDSPAACRAHILNSICQAMQEALKNSREYQKLGEGLVSRMNHLNEAVHNLERDLGHRVSAEELSAYLEMPLEEIRSLLNTSGEQISLRTSENAPERGFDPIE